MTRDELRDFLGQLVTTEGQCEFAEQVAKGTLTMAELEARAPRRLRPGITRYLECVETISRNPCARCGTYQLQSEYIGSGCCSERCYAFHTAKRDLCVFELEATERLFLAEGELFLRRGERILWNGVQVSQDGVTWLPGSDVKQSIAQGWLVRAGKASHA